MINSLECRVHSCSEVDLQSTRSVIFVVVKLNLDYAFEPGKLTMGGIFCI